jgi:hypothetical protein
MSIVATGSLDGYFGELVGESIRTKGVHASGGASAYLVSLLSDYSHPERSHDDALHKPLGLLLGEALHEPDLGVRFDKLRSLGDGVLYASGFFSDHFAARGVDAKYLEGIGARAYGTASGMLRSSSSTTSLEEAAAAIDIFRELADRFSAFVAVIADVADAALASNASGARQLLRLYERWLKTGSDRIAGALSTQGMLPMRGPKGLH